MNRPLKFRVWDDSTKHMYEVMGLSQMTYDDDCAGEPEWKHTTELQEVAIREPRDGITYEKPVWVPTTNLTLMQYTGLKDTNGREIYEGDVVEVKTSNREDAWSYGHRPVEHWKSGFYISFGRRNLLHCWLAWSHVVVVGNIYENPELLERSAA